MTQVTTRTFRSGNSEAVRLPKNIGYGCEVDVLIERIGEVITIRPLTDAAAERKKVLDFVAKLRALPAPGILEIRDTTEMPEPRGL